MNARKDLRVSSAYLGIFLVQEMPKEPKMQVSMVSGLEKQDLFVLETSIVLNMSYLTRVSAEAAVSCLVQTK